LIKHIIDSGHRKGKHVAMCGEIAADISFTKVLLGMGLDEFSVPPALVLKLKKLIRSFTFSEAKDLVNEIFVLTKRDDVVAKLLSEKNYKTK
jgi:phosphotransferase system enzyme I (PtsI)